MPLRALKSPYFALAPLSAILLLSAFSPAATPGANGHHAPAAAGADHHVDWTYDGPTGPEHWAGLDPSCAECSGHEQSPVALQTSEIPTPGLPSLIFGYSAAPRVATNNGHTVAVEAKNDCKLQVGQHACTLANYHFHAPSEHTLNGERFAMEVHFVHLDAQGRRAVVGVLCRQGAANAAFAPFAANLPAKVNETKPVPAFDPLTLMPANKNYITYMGSLTRPPCNENVLWMVLKTPVELSASQIGQFTARYDHNSRPTQPVYERKLQQN